MRDVQRLRLLLELDRRGSIAAVAEALHYSPSGVSQQLSQLETEAGVALLERVGRGVQLTDAGRLLAGHADEVVVRLERARAELAAFHDEPSGCLRIGCFQTAALTLVPSVLNQVSSHPSLRVEFTQVEPEEALPALLSRELDLVVGEEYPGFPVVISDAVERVDLCTDPMWLALPEGTDTAREPTVDDAMTVPWVMEPHHSTAREWATAVCRSAGFEPDVRFESSDMLMHRELVRSGRAAAFLPSMLCRNFPVQSPSGSLDHARTIFTVVRQGYEQHPAVLSVRRAFRKAATMSTRQG